MGKQNILLIDDDMELCALLKEYLVDEGFELDICNDGITGSEEALSQKHDLVSCCPGATGSKCSKRSGSKAMYLY